MKKFVISIERSTVEALVNPRSIKINQNNTLNLKENAIEKNNAINVVIQKTTIY